VRVQELEVTVVQKAGNASSDFLTFTYGVERSGK